MTDDHEGSDFGKWIAYGRKRGWVGRDRRIVEPYDDGADEGVIPADWEAGKFAGKGPKDFQRSDHSIEDELYKRLTHHPDLDASDIEIAVNSGVVTLKGFAENKYEKRLAAEIAENVLGVTEVQDSLRLKEFGFRAPMSSAPPDKSTAAPSDKSAAAAPSDKSSSASALQTDVGKLPDLNSEK